MLLRSFQQLGLPTLPFPLLARLLPCLQMLLELLMLGELVGV